MSRPTSFGPGAIDPWIADNRASRLLRATGALLGLTCAVVVLLALGAVPASADTWTVEGGTHRLKNGSGETLKSWTPKEWILWRKEVQAVGECMGVSEDCAAHEIAGETPIETFPG